MTRAARYGLGVVVAGGVLLTLLLLPWSQWALLLVEWIHGAGALGVGVYAFAYLVSCPRDSLTCSGRGIPAGGVARRAHIPDMLAPRALPAGRRAPEHLSKNPWDRTLAATLLLLPGSILTAGAGFAYWGGLVATLLVTILITKIARKALDQALARKPPIGLPTRSEVRP